MYVQPVNKDTIVAFIHGYGAAKPADFDFINLIEDHFLHKYSIRGSNAGWPWQIQQHADKNTHSWITSFRQESLEILVGKSKSIQQQVRKHICQYVERIKEDSPYQFNDHWVREWTEICLINKAWFRQLWTSDQLAVIKAITKEINNDPAYIGAEPYKASAKLMKLKAKFEALNR